MNALATALRRSLWLLLIGAVGGAAWSYWRDRTTPAAPGPAEWPPLEPETSATPDPTPAPESVSDATPETAPDTEVRGFASISDPDIEPDDAPGDAAAADAASEPSTGAAWVEPDDDGACPISHPIKANDNSGIYHVPEGRFYERTKAERCYVDSDAAEADGYRRSKS
ncbi:MAG: hypothetical protein AAGF91_03560 [Actinomycetota bacterium]